MYKIFRRLAIFIQASECTPNLFCTRAHPLTPAQMTRPCAFSSRNKQAGATLIETMVSLFVLGVGLFGVMAMQLKSIQQGQNTFTYSQAIVLANDLCERIKSSKAPADEITAWQLRVKQQLPGGEGEISGTGTGLQTVTITFNEKISSLPLQDKRTITFQSWL